MPTKPSGFSLPHRTSPAQRRAVPKDVATQRWSLASVARTAARAVSTFDGV